MEHPTIIGLRLRPFDGNDHTAIRPTFSSRHEGYCAESFALPGLELRTALALLECTGNYRCLQWLVPAKMLIHQHSEVAKTVQLYLYVHKKGKGLLDDFTANGDSESGTSLTDAISSSSGDDYDSFMFEDLCRPPDVTELNSLFAQVKDELTLVASKNFLEALNENKSHCAEAGALNVDLRTEGLLKQYDIPASSWLAQNVSFRQETEDFSKNEWLKHGYFACPYYVTSPGTHLQCLSCVSLRTINDVKRHLWDSHRRPEYCPSCLDIFESASDCNKHIRSRSCGLVDTPLPEGLIEEQMRALARRTTLNTSETSQWFDIWRIVFPLHEAGSDIAMPYTPYLTGQLESKICSLRDFWFSQGQIIIARFLEQKGLQRYDIPDEERNLGILHHVVLNDLIDRLIQTSQPDVSNT